MSESEFEEFLVSLRVFCNGYGVQLTPSMYDSLQVWKLDANDDPLYFPSIENKTRIPNE